MRTSLRLPGHARFPAAVLAYDLETIAPPTLDGTFPPWSTHLPVAAGFAEARHQDGEWVFDIAALVTAGETTEADLIREADRRIGAVDVVTTYNGRGFDSLVLRLAAQRQRIWCAKAIANHAAAPRFGAEHDDLADLYNSHGRKVSLAAIAEQIGVPIKTDIAGGDVAALWEQGETERIRRYVAEDATATLVVWFAWSAARAGDEALVTRPMAALARHLERTTNLAHLSPFVDSALMRWCRPRALHADIAAALDRVSAKLGREENERAFATA